MASITASGTLSAVEQKIFSSAIDQIVFVKITNNSGLNSFEVTLKKNGDPAFPKSPTQTLAAGAMMQHEIELRAGETLSAIAQVNDALAFQIIS